MSEGSGTEAIIRSSSVESVWTEGEGCGGGVSTSEVTSLAVTTVCVTAPVSSAVTCMLEDSGLPYSNNSGIDTIILSNSASFGPDASILLNSPSSGTDTNVANSHFTMEAPIAGVGLTCTVDASCINVSKDVQSVSLSAAVTPSNVTVSTPPMAALASESNDKVKLSGWF